MSVAIQESLRPNQASSMNLSKFKQISFRVAVQESKFSNNLYELVEKITLKKANVYIYLYLTSEESEKMGDI